MQALFKKLLPSRAAPVVLPDCDLRGFDLADSLEVGGAREILANWSEPIKEGAMYIVRKSPSNNEWVVLDYRTMSFVMRGVVDVDLDGGFSSSFDPRVIASNDQPARMRVAIYLYQSDDKLTESSNPTVVMMSNGDRTDWRAYLVNCEACRYKRRRSSFTEGSDPSSPVSASPQQDSSSPCSYYGGDTRTDFADICSVVPSCQEILRMSHTSVQLNECTFTKMKISIPKEGCDWCPIAHPKHVLRETTNCEQDVVRLESRQPIWSTKFKALALEFKQRNVLPSRRNFQLVRPGEPPTAETVCQYYRTGKNEYVIEVQAEASLSLVQTFCVAVSSTLWQ